ncbi:MAG TPA: DUF302 domain-containing protein [Bacteroidota bacterium]|nr:DUF302 domain-containing protein [Bacteroidota bacterium]
MRYGFFKTVSLPFGNAVERVTEELKREGFGILTTIDIQDTLKKRLGINFRKYLILGACNPPLAHEALQAEENIGLLLPCNVVVYEEEKTTVIGVFDPMSMNVLVDNPKLQTIAETVGRKLHKALDAVPTS